MPCPFLVHNGLPIIIFHQIKRPKFTFIKDAAQVFPDDTEEKELDTADEEDNGDERRITWHVFPANQRAQDDEEHIEDSNKGQHAADKGRDPQRRDGETRDTFNGQIY